MFLKLIETKGPLPTSFYEIIVDNIVVGFCQLRHRPSKSDTMPDGFESNIYYEIKPEFQGKGHATRALFLILGEAKKLGLSGVILTAREDNIASQKVIQKNSGMLLDTKEDQKGFLNRKYRIEL